MTKELRPLKILLYCDPKDERTLNLEHVTKMYKTQINKSKILIVLVFPHIIEFQ